MAIWILPLLFASSYGLFETSEYVQEIFAKETLQKEVENPDFLTFVLIYTSDSPKSPLLVDPITTISIRFHNYMRFLAYDCINDHATCTPEVKESLPMVSAYVPGGLNPYTGKPLVYQRNYEGTGSAEELGSFVRKHTPYLGTYLTLDNLDGFLADSLNKVILFTNKDSTPILYKGLTSHFRGKLEFGLVWANQTSVLRRFDVESFPTLLVQDEESQSVYGGEMEFDDIALYLEKFAKKREKLVYKNFNKKEEKKAEEQVANDLLKSDVLKLTASNLQKKLEKEEKLAVVMFYKDKMWWNWEELSEIYGGVVTLGTFKVEKQRDEELAKELGVRSYPSIKLFPVNRKRKPIEVDGLDDLQELINREIKYEITPLSDNVLQVYLKSIYEENKVGCILFSNSEIPISFKGLASDPRFKEQVKFGYYSSSNSNVLTSLNVRRYPSVACYVVTDEKLNMQSAEFPGLDISSYPALAYFLEEQFLPQFNRSAKKISEEDIELEWLDEFHAKNFHNLCEKKGGICVISFLDGHAEDEKNLAHVTILKKVKAEMEAKKYPLRFGWVDGVCQHELRSSFNIQETALPNLAVYVPGKKKAANLIGKFSEEDIKLYLEKAIGGKASVYDKNGVKFESRDCEEFYETLLNVSQESEDDELIQQILAEEERRRKELGLESDSSSGKSKKGKRGKKRKREDL